MPARKVGRHPGPCAGGHDQPLSIWENESRRWASCSVKEWDGSYCNREPLNPDPLLLGGQRSTTPTQGPPPPQLPPPDGGSGPAPSLGPVPAEVGAALLQVADAILTGAGQIAAALADRGTPEAGPRERVAEVLGQMRCE